MTTYTCPHHPEIRLNHPGTCPKCGGMELVPLPMAKTSQETQKSKLQKYMPLIIIVSLIALAAITAAWNRGAISWIQAMQYFMASFFFVFSGFKLLDVRGFADGYSQYDLLAQRWHGYGYMYPFMELALGIGYIRIPSYVPLHLATIILMVFSGIGVTMKVAKREKFQCACLGTLIDIPLTYVTIIEDFGMAAMAAIVLWID